MPVPEHHTARPRTALAAGGLLLVLAVSACGSDTDTDTDTAAAASPFPTPAPSAVLSAEPSPAAPSPAASPSSAAASDEQVITVTYADGAVSGAPARVDVPLGKKVLLKVDSDVADEVHVHGYDLTGDVPAGGSAEITFTADVPGVFEVELESLGTQLFQLKVA